MAELSGGQWLVAAGSALGGVGLFLLAVGMITDGLRVAAGGALRQILGSWTSSTLRGVLAGVGITALVQSSSAVTVATIGFVNAGLLTLYQALGVIYGSNVGTTMTGWLVASVGFEFKLALFALPLVGVGMVLRLAAGDGRVGAIGRTLVGFGLFFIGLDVLKDAFAGLTGMIGPGRDLGTGLGAMALYVAMGFLITLVTQSSSAAIAITLTAANGGLLSLAGAAAMVIGANVGTTSTAGLAVIGATPNAKRVAVAHMAFNLITAVVALLLLPGMLWLVRATGDVLGLHDAPAVSLALFHTAFNLLGVLIMFPLSRRLSDWLANRFRTYEEIAGRPKHLDPNVVVMPSLALNALVLETARVGQHARGLAQAVLSAERQSPSVLRAEHAVVVELTNAIGDFMTRLQRSSLPAAVAEALPTVMRTGQYYLEIADIAQAYANDRSLVEYARDERITAQTQAYVGKVSQLLAHADPQGEGFDMAVCQAEVDAIGRQYSELKNALLQLGTKAPVAATQVGELLDQLRRLRRIAQQVAKGAGYLAGLLAAVRHPDQVLAAKEVGERPAQLIP